jgi:hypothetical protein
MEMEMEMATAMATAIETIISMHRPQRPTSGRGTAAF